MAGVVTDVCIRCKHMDCVEVCPVDAFYEGENMLVINPFECVDCGCCIGECPINAIVFNDDPLAEPWSALNAEFSAIWPNVTFDGGQTPGDAAEFRSVTGKFETYFSPKPGQGDVGTRVRALRSTSCSKCKEDRLLSRIANSIRRFFQPNP
jgi:ferredoxin